MLSKEDLIAFEEQVARAKQEGEIGQPIHLSGGNESQLLRIFEQVNPEEDWIFSTYRNHYHALLFGIPPEELMSQIRAGRSMTPLLCGRRFFTSAIVGGCIPIAVGVAEALKRQERSGWVWCFVGDMAASIGTFHDAQKYTSGHSLPLTFVVEDNGLSCDTPTDSVWGEGGGTKRPLIERYSYQRIWPHQGVYK